MAIVARPHRLRQGRTGTGGMVPCRDEDRLAEPNCPRDVDAFGNGRGRNGRSARHNEYAGGKRRGHDAHGDVGNATSLAIADDGGRDGAHDPHRRCRRRDRADRAPDADNDARDHDNGNGDLCHTVADKYVTAGRNTAARRKRDAVADKYLTAGRNTPTYEHALGNAVTDERFTGRRAVGNANSDADVGAPFHRGPGDVNVRELAGTDNAERYGA